MPRIFDNLAPDSSLLPALQETLGLSSRADFCVGYFNLRGWSGLAPLVDSWQPEDGPCRVLIGMQRLPHDDLRQTLSLVDRPSSIDNQTAHRNCSDSRGVPAGPHIGHSCDDPLTMSCRRSSSFPRRRESRYVSNIERCWLQETLDSGLDPE